MVDLSVYLLILIILLLSAMLGLGVYWFTERSKVHADFKTAALAALTSHAKLASALDLNTATTEAQTSVVALHTQAIADQQARIAAAAATITPPVDPAPVAPKTDLPAGVTLASLAPFAPPVAQPVLPVVPIPEPDWMAELRTISGNLTALQAPALAPDPAPAPRPLTVPATVGAA